MIIEGNPGQNGRRYKVEVEETLARVPLFRQLDKGQIRSLAKFTRTRTYQPGEVLVHEGRLGFGLYCLQSGEVKVTQQTSGGEHELARLGPGQSFGEIALIDEGPRTATVTAVEPTTAVLLDKMQFHTELRNHPEVALTVMMALVQWLREANKRIAELA
jgi:CRP-like cAMP-binding protein